MSQFLADAAEAAVTRALRDKSVVKGTNEPSEVARLVNALPDHLVKEWSSFVVSGAMTVSAAFCHAKPRVSWASPLVGNQISHEPELGDLLFIMDVQGKTGRERRALMIQVKKSTNKNLKCTLSSEGDLVQRHMYSEWPNFDVLGAQPITTNPPPHNVDISTPFKAKNLQSRYAVVRSATTTSPGWTLELATAPFKPSSTSKTKTFKSLGSVIIGAQQSLGNGLAELYKGVIGRDCDIGDDWSELVEYLEDYVGNHTSSSALPHVQTTHGAIPTGLRSATSFLSAPHTTFVGYSGNRHLLTHSGFSQWMDPELLCPGAHGGVLYKWPRHNYPTGRLKEEFKPDSGFGVIRIALDQPLKIEDETMRSK